MTPGGPSGSFLARTIHGRGPALETIGALVDEPGGALALVGEAGIGKTRLATWAAERAAERRLVVVEGAATLGLVEPLGIFRDLVRGARRAGVEPPVGDPLASSFPARLLPELGAGDGETGNLGAVFDAAARYLSALAGRRGALVVLEDLHWADATSLSLITFLARALRGEPVALLLTYRPDEAAAGAAMETMRSELRRGRLADEVGLDPLDEVDAAAMLIELLDGPPTPEVTGELMRLSGGNPFALEELTRAAADSGWLDPETGRRRGTGRVQLPWTLAESIRARASRLDPGERDLLEWAASVGDRFDLRLVAAASALSQDEVLTRVDGLVAAGLVVEVSGDASGNVLGFRHALVREALVQEVSAARRRQRHARILGAAETLTAEGTLDVSAGDLARHAVAAGERERAMTHSRGAAASAQELGAVEEAVEHLERALSLWSDRDGVALRAELLLTCGGLRIRVFRSDERAVQLLEEAVSIQERLGDREAAAECRATLAAARWWIGEVAQSFEDWATALSELRLWGSPQALRAALADQARAFALKYHQNEALAAADEGLLYAGPASTAQDAFDRISLLSTKGMVSLWRCDAETGQALLNEAAELALKHHDDVGTARALHILAMANTLLQPAPVSAELLRRAAELVARHGLRSLQAGYLALLSWVAVSACEWEAARSHISAAEALLDDGDPSEAVRWELDAARAALFVGVGELDDADAAFRDLLERRIAIEVPRYREEGLEGIAAICLMTGDPQGAADLMRPVVNDYLALIESGDAEVEVAGLKVSALVAAGDLDRAALIVSWARQLLPGHPTIRYCEALVDIGRDPVAAGRLIGEALSERERDGWRLDGLQGRLVAAGIATRTDGGGPAAAALVREALSQFRELGADTWCRRLEALLRSWGERSPTRAGPGAGGLSRRELEVLGLVAEGLTNRQIAERLVISEHTAIRHVSNLMSKLGAPSRAAAVRAAAERGLLPADGGARAGAPG